MGCQNSSDETAICLGLVKTFLTDHRHFYPQGGQSLSRDLETLESRVAREGMSFLTKTLPRLGKAVDSAFESGCFTRPQEFKQAHGRTHEVPAFVESWFNPVLDREGRLHDVSPEWVKSLRQLAFMFYKYELPYSPQTEAAAISQFARVEGELKTALYPFDDWDVQMSRDLLAEVLEGFDPFDVTPRHGPGAVAEREVGDAKWAFTSLYVDSEPFYPSWLYFMPAGSLSYRECRQWWESLERKPHGTSRVVLVPKDSRGPRTIACEPLAKQFLQQGLMKSLVRWLEQSDRPKSLRTRLTAGRVNFTDQEINRQAALRASKSGEWSTMDLSEASDRVGCPLVEFLFPPDIAKALMAVRSTHAKLPDGSELALRKYATMGSATCFPVEALSFWALSVCAIAHRSGKSATEVADHVLVYGDDILVRDPWMPVVVEVLEKCHLVVNRSKSFQRGPFRESCGMDAFSGVDVTPVKFRTRWSGKTSDGNAYASWTAYANGLEARGFPNTASATYRVVEDTYGDLPFGTPDAAYVCRHAPSWEAALVLNFLTGVKLRKSPEGDASYQRFEAKVKFLQAPDVASNLDGWERLVRNLTAGPGDSPDTLTHPRSVQLRTGWRAVG